MKASPCLFSALAGAVLSWAAGVAEMRASLLIYYPLDETSGNTAFDAAADNGQQNATAGSLVTSSDWQIGAGLIGGALRFSPTAQTDVDEALIYDTAATTDSILAAHPFTVSYWVQTTAHSNLTQAAIFLGDRTQTARYYASGLAPTTDLPQLVARNTTAVNTPGPTAINDGQWHHVAAVFAASDFRILYVDGMEAAASVTNVTHPVLNRFGVGALTRSNQTDSFNGTLDEVGLFDTAKTAAEVALLNAFPRYDEVTLDSPVFTQALDVFFTQTGSVDTGTWTWSFASDLIGPVGFTQIVDGRPTIVMDSGGNGLIAIPEPGSAVLLVVGVAVVRWRRRTKVALAD